MHAEGVKEVGGEAALMSPGEFEPMFAGIQGVLGGKKIALFGSCGWGMDIGCGIGSANLYDKKDLIINEAPDAAGQETCRELGWGLAKW